MLAGIEAARTSMQTARDRRASLEADKNAAETEAAEADAACRGLEEKIAAPSQHADVTYEIAVKEATLAELEREDAPAATLEDGDAKVLGAAAEIVEAEFKPRQAQLLEEVSLLTLDYARRFGMQTL